MLTNVVDWLITENCFSWFTGDGFTFIFCCLVLVGCVAVCCSKKLREKFF